MPQADRVKEGAQMDVARIIEELRSERREIEQAILLLERAGPRGARPTWAKPGAVVEIGRARQVDDGSCQPPDMAA